MRRQRWTAPAPGTIGEWPALEWLYLGLPAVDFSREVPASRPDRLVVLPVQGVHRDDLGNPERVVGTRRRARSRSHAMADSRMPERPPVSVPV